MPTVHFKEILPFSSVIFELRDVFSLDYFDLISADCLIRVNLWTKFYVIVFAPVLLIVIIQARAKLQWCGWKRRKADTDTAIRHISTVAIARALAARAKAKSQAHYRNRAVQQCCIVIFFFYPMMSSAIFQMLDCRDLDFGQRWHQYDLSIDCHGETYRRVEVLSWFLVLAVPLGIPIFFGVVLWLNRDRLSIDHSGDIDFDVFHKICTDLHPDLDEETIKALFADVDIDGNGHISPSEIYSYAFFSELERRVATERKEHVLHATSSLRTASHQIVQMQRGILGFDDGTSSDDGGSDEDGHSIWVGKFPDNVASEEDLSKHFSRFGKVLSVTVRRKPGYLKSWAFVTYVHKRDAAEAVAAGVRKEVAVTDEEGYECVLKINEVTVGAELQRQASQQMPVRLRCFLLSCCTCWVAL